MPWVYSSCLTSATACTHSKFPTSSKVVSPRMGDLHYSWYYHASDIHEMLVTKYKPTVRSSLPWSQLSCVTDRVYWAAAILWAMDELYPLLLSIENFNLT